MSCACCDKPATIICFCRTCYDLWRESPERTYVTRRGMQMMLADFVSRVQAERRNRCS